MTDYLIIGGTGSLGKKLIERLLPTNSIAVYSRDEAKHWSIRNELSTHAKINDLSFYVGDIRDKQRLKDVIQQTHPKTIIIAAALKQVDTCELSPSESVLTNVVGTQNVIDVVNSLSHQLKYLDTVLFISTDKACRPINSYGMCKALSERLITSQAQISNNTIRFLGVRYGNVLESRGSIIPLFKYQSENSEFLTVTDPNMTRFVMTLDDSVDLIQKALDNAENGEIWLPKLSAMKIGDLAKIFADKHNKQIKIVGLRPGEKMHEDLISESESSRVTYDDELDVFIMLPAFKTCNKPTYTYTSSDDVMSYEVLEDFLKQRKIINKPIEEFKGLSIEEIATNRVD